MSLLSIALTTLIAAAGTTEELASEIAAGTSTSALQGLRGDKKTISTLEKIAKERSGSERARLYEAIARLDTKDAKAATERALRGLDPYAKSGAIRGVAKGSDDRLKNAIFANASSRDPLVRDAVFEAFALTDAIDDPRFESLLDSNDEYAREVSLRYLGMSKNNKKIGARIEQALDDQSPIVQTQALILIGQLKREDLAVPSARLALSTNPLVSSQAVTTLGLLEGKESNRALAALVGHPRAPEPIWKRAADLLEARNQDELLELGLKKAPAERRGTYAELQQHETPPIPEARL